MDAMSHGGAAGQPLEIEVEEFAVVGPLVAGPRGGGAGPEPSHPELAQEPPHRGAREPELVGDLGAGLPLGPEGDDLGHHGGRGLVR